MDAGRIWIWEWNGDDDNSSLFAVVLGRKGKTVAKIDPFTGSVEELFPYNYQEIQHPVQHGKWVYFTNTTDGTDNIYAFDLKEKKNYQVTSSRFGAKDAQVSSDGRFLIYSNYTSDGFKTVKSWLNSTSFKFVDPTSVYKYELADKLSAQDAGIPEFGVMDTTYLTRRY